MKKKPAKEKEISTEKEQNNKETWFSKMKNFEEAHRKMDSDKSVFDSIQAILMMLDRNGRIEYINRYMQQISGYSLEEVKGKSWFDTFLPERDRGRIRKLFKEAIGDIQTQGNINPIVTKDGKEREIEWHDMTVRNDKGVIMGLVSIGQDVTERIGTERQIQRKREDLELVNGLNGIINHGGSMEDAIRELANETRGMFISYGATVYLMNDDGNCLIGQNLNMPPRLVKLIEKIIGMKIPRIEIKLNEGSFYGEMIKEGKPRILDDPELIKRCIVDFTDKEIIKKLVPRIYKVLGIKTVMSVPLMSGEEAIGLMDISSAETFNEDDLKRFTTIARQITGIIRHKQAEEKLRHSEDKYRNIIEYSPVGIITIGKDGIIESSNETFSEVTGISAGEIVGKDISEIPVTIQGDKGKYQELFEAALGNEQIPQFELKWMHRDGSFRQGEIRSSAIRSGGKIIGVQIITRDITERRQEQEKYKAIIKDAPDGFWLSDSNGKLLDVNDKYCKITGYNRQELLGMNIKDLEAKEKPDEVTKHIESIMNKGADIFETQHKCKDGSIKDVEISARYIEIGEATQLVFIRDMTERKMAQKALNESEEKYRSLVKNVRLGVFRSTPGETGRFLEVNPAMQDITGYSREELLNINVSDLFLKPEQRIVTLDKMSRVSGMITMELEFKKKDGSQIIVSDTKAPVKDKNGKVLYFDGILEDITERKQSEEELKESEERYRALFESTFDIVQSVAQDGSYIFVNPAWFRTMGYSKDELARMNMFDAIHPKSIKHCRKIFDRVMQGESVNYIKATFLAKNGRNVEVEGSIIPRVINGKVIASQGFYRDISEKVKMEEQLIVTDRLACIGELASGVAHELNNPLTGVIGFSELLLEKEVPNDIREDIAIIHHEAIRAAEVVKNLLTFAHKHTPSKQAVNINSTIASVLGLRAYEQKVKNIKVVTQFDQDLPDVIADGFQLQQVFLNIVVNAGYAMEEANNGGVLTIKTERDKGIVRALFIDDGLGIKEEDMKYIFDPFYTTKEVGKGTGLGLSICHGIITEHKGKIYARSEQGEGTTFVVELPADKPEKEGR